MSQDEHDDALDSAFRRASEADAGRPSAATRAAILARAAEQAREARRQAPAANDSRLAWRAAAGVAVLGVAVLLWRQSETQLPGQPPRVTVAEAPPEVAEPMAAAAPAPAQRMETEALSAKAPAGITAPASPASRPGVPLPAPALAPAPAPVVVPAATPPPAVAAESVSADALLADESARVASPPSARSAPPSAARDRRESVAEGASLGLARSVAASSSRAATLLQQQFPELDERDAPATVWMVLDARGTVLRQGELPVGRSLEDMAREIAAAPDGLRLAPWRSEVLLNQAGRPITVALAEIL